MAIEADWGNLEETLITMKFRGNWNARELFDAQQAILQMANSKSYTVSLIVDMRAASLKMNGVLALARQLIPTQPPNLGVVAIITTTNYWQQMYRTLPASLTASLNLKFVSDVDTAYDMVEQYQAQHTPDDTPHLTG